MEYKINNGQVRFSTCPICKEENKKHDHFCVNLAKGVYYCHKSNAGGKIEDLHPFFEEVYYPLFMEGGVITPMDTAEPVEKDYLNIMQETWEDFHSQDIEYFRSRGIENINNVKKFATMTHSGHLMIPITDGTKLLGLKYRQIHGQKKCWVETGSQLLRLLNWQNAKPKGARLVIVEGEIDLASVLEAGYTHVVSLPNGAQNLNAIQAQKAWLAEADVVALALDNDESGKKATERVINMLRGKIRNIARCDLGNYKDFNEMLLAEGKGAIISCIQNAQIEEQESEFYIEDSCYWRQSQKGDRKLTSFWLDIQGYSQHVIKADVHYSQGLSSQTVHIPREAVASKSELMSIIGGDVMCSPNDIAQLINYLLDEAYAGGYQCDTIDYYGIHDTTEGMKYYTPMDRVVCDRQDMVFAEYNPYMYKAGDELPNRITSTMLNMRSDNVQSLVLLSWWAGRLYHLNEKYPILELVGTTSSGKSEVMEFMERLGQGKYENITTFDNLTAHQIRSIAGCSNITPFCIDEIKFTGKTAMQKASDLSGLIRSVYDNKPLRKGNLTNKLDVYLCYTPMILSGESRIEDSSVQNRMISAMLTKENKADKAVFDKLKSTDMLERLGATLIQRRITRDRKLVTNYDLIDDITDDRQHYNIACIIDGLYALGEYLNISLELKKAVVAYLKGEQKANIQLCQVVEWLIDLQETDNYQNQIEGYQWYICDEMQHMCRWSEMYKQLVDLKNKTNDPRELLDSRAFKKICKGEGLIREEKIARIGGRVARWVYMDNLKEFCTRKNILIGA